MPRQSVTCRHATMSGCVQADANRLLPLSEDDEAREVKIAREILANLSAADRQSVETTLANIRALANELIQMHHQSFGDLSHPGSQWVDRSGESRHGAAFETVVKPA